MEDKPVHSRLAELVLAIVAVIGLPLNFWMLLTMCDEVEGQRTERRIESTLSYLRVLESYEFQQQRRLARNWLVAHPGSDWPEDEAIAMALQATLAAYADVAILCDLGALDAAIVRATVAGEITDLVRLAKARITQIRGFESLIQFEEKMHRPF